MRRIAIAAAAAAVAILVISQLLVPPLVARHIEHQLTERGGRAHVALAAFPAFRLLAGDGDRLRVRASGLQLALGQPGGGTLGKLDGFDAVDVRVTGSRAGPFSIARAQLERSGGQPYRLTLDASANAEDLSSYAGSQLGGSIGGLFGAFAGGVLGLVSKPIPVDIAAQVTSSGGQPVVEHVDASVAGVPAGPLAEALAVALSGRL